MIARALLQLTAGHEKLLEKRRPVEVHLHNVLVHALQVASDVHLLLGTIRTEWTLELRFFATFPFLVVAQ